MTSSSPGAGAAPVDEADTLREESGRSRLSKRAVVDRALALADATGLDALTIRKLAQELGVTPMALYWHFRSKEELLDGLADRVWSEIDVNVDSAAPWPAQLRTMVESLVRVLREHPAAPQLLMNSEKQSEASLHVTEVALEVLRGAGFDPLNASEVARSGLWTGIMLVMSEPGIKSLSLDERAELQRRKQVTLATLPVAVYPRLVECAAPMTACDNPEFHYEFGVSLFIAGVEAMAANLPAQDAAS
ncbi:MAG TPA: TetR family transcriptional regulator [Trebonia sp.]